MNEIPIKTRHRILRKARMYLAQGEGRYICQVLRLSYPRFFNQILDVPVLNFFPEVAKRKPTVTHFDGMWFEGNNERQDRINLLSDAINEINAKIKAEAANISAVAQGNGKPSRREKAVYNANQW